MEDIELWDPIYWNLHIYQSIEVGAAVVAGKIYAMLRYGCRPSQQPDPPML